MDDTSDVDDTKEEPRPERDAGMDAADDAHTGQPDASPTPDPADASVPTTVTVTLNTVPPEAAAELVLDFDGSSWMPGMSPATFELPIEANDRYPVRIASQGMGHECVIAGTAPLSAKDLASLIVECVEVSPTETVLVDGVVQDFATGATLDGAIASFTIAGQVQSEVADEDGAVSLTLPSSGETLVAIEHPDYAPQYVRLNLDNVGDGAAFAWSLNPVLASAEFDATEAQDLGVPGTVAGVSLPANALLDAQGEPYTGIARALLAPIDPSSGPEAMPGGFTSVEPASGTLSTIESFGALDVRLETMAGEPLQLAEGQVAVVRIPVAASAIPNAPESMPLYYFDTELGHWVEEGSATLNTSEDALFYEGDVSHFTPWNVDRRLSEVRYASCVVDSAGNPVTNARVEVVGNSYISSSRTSTDSEGWFDVPVRSDSSFLVYTTSPVRSRVREGYSGSSDVTNSECLVMSAAAADLRVTLSWGAEPEDLDLHFISATTHVSYSNPSATVEGATVELDTDDTDGFGPEIISAGQLPPGTYRFAVHHFSGSSTVAASPGRLRVQTRGIDRTYTPSGSRDTTGSTDTWIAIDVVVDDEGEISVRPVDSYTSQETLRVDCPDAMGEFGPDCGDLFECGDGSKVSILATCDGVNDCEDASDEALTACASTDFECADGDWIPQSWVCDGDDDCAEASDETPDLCPGRYFSCNDGGQTSTSWVCDGDDNCADASDEDPVLCGDEAPRRVTFSCPGDGTPCIYEPANLVRLAEDSNVRFDMSAPDTVIPFARLKSTVGGSVCEVSDAGSSRIRETVACAAGTYTIDFVYRWVDVGPATNRPMTGSVSW